jgi:calcineurin-like phosphoesterase family protein
MTIWFSADSHYSHRNIIEYSKRPFANVEEMNAAMIERWNAVVKPSDQVWFLGDFALDERVVPAIASQLIGRKMLVPGNHDSVHPRRHGTAKKQFRFYNDFEVCEWKVNLPLPLHLVGIQFLGMHLTHMPPTEYEDPRYPEWRPDASKHDLILHGHVHERYKTKKVGKCVCINVGVDQWAFTPVALETVLELAKTVQ